MHVTCMVMDEDEVTSTCAANFIATEKTLSMYQSQ